MPKREITGHQYHLEADVAAGLEAIAATELRVCFPQHVHQLEIRSGTLQFQFSGQLTELAQLRTIQAVYLVYSFPIPRPKALLGDQHFRMLLRQISTTRSMHPAGTFQTLHLNAAGSNSSVMQRLTDALAIATGLTRDDEQGDLLLRVRRCANGWETLVRLTPRPLATRDWRVCNYEGALNATVANAMLRLTQPAETDICINLGCGSGSLLIERAQWPTQHLIGIDHDPIALDCAVRNCAAAGNPQSLTLMRADVTSLPLAAQSADVLCADLPFGQRSGSNETNQWLYPALIAEAARVARPGARLVLITHALRLIEATLEHDAGWSVERQLRVNLRGLHPVIYLLRRRT